MNKTYKEKYIELLSFCNKLSDNVYRTYYDESYAKPESICNSCGSTINLELKAEHLASCIWEELDEKVKEYEIFMESLNKSSKG